ncbi:MAG: helix-turn-helix domain-containing protein [Cyanobacteria bacterium P01_E01_bin.6]
MASPYSNDLRLKAVTAVDRGEPKSHVARMFHISRNTLELWLKRRERTGSVSPECNFTRGPKPKIADLEAFRRFAKQYGHLTQA